MQRVTASRISSFRSTRRSEQHHRSGVRSARQIIHYRHMVQLRTWDLRSKRCQHSKSIGLLITTINLEMQLQREASLRARRGTMATTTTMMMTARSMMASTKMMKSMMTMTWAKMERVTTTATLVTSEAAGMETSVPFHVAFRGDQEGLEAVVLRHHPRQGGVARARHRVAIRCCQLIQ